MVSKTTNHNLIWFVFFVTFVTFVVEKAKGIA